MAFSSDLNIVFLLLKKEEKHFYGLILPSFQLRFNPFCYRFYMIISRMILRWIHLNPLLQTTKICLNFFFFYAIFADGKFPTKT